MNHENNQTTLVVKLKAIEISDDNGQLDDQEVSTARTELVIRLIDVNDEKPTFDKERKFFGLCRLNLASQNFVLIAHRFRTPQNTRSQLKRTTSRVAFSVRRW